jgi:hypothetical protein
MAVWHARALCGVARIVRFTLGSRSSLIGLIKFCLRTVQERLVREIRTLRAMWRALETGPQRILNGHEGVNLGHKPRKSLRATALAVDPTR